jgi:hypothetical protein
MSQVVSFIKDEDEDEDEDDSDAVAVLEPAAAAVAACDEDDDDAPTCADCADSSSRYRSTTFLMVYFLHTFRVCASVFMIIR